MLGISTSIKNSLIYKNRSPIKEHSDSNFNKTHVYKSTHIETSLVVISRQCHVSPRVGWKGKSSQVGCRCDNNM